MDKGEKIRFASHLLTECIQDALALEKQLEGKPGIDAAQLHAKLQIASKITVEVFEDDIRLILSELLYSQDSLSTDHYPDT